MKTFCSPSLSPNGGHPVGAGRGRPAAAPWLLVLGLGCAGGDPEAKGGEGGFTADGAGEGAGGADGGASDGGGSDGGGSDGGGSDGGAPEGAYLLTQTRDDAQPWRTTREEWSATGLLTGVDGAAPTGAVHYELVVDDEPVCVLDVDLVGAPYAGDCLGCDLALSIEATLSAATPATDPRCANRFLQTFEDLPGDDYEGPPVLGFWSSRSTGAGAPLTNMLAARWRSPVPDGSGTSAPIWHDLAVDGAAPPYGRATRSGDRLEWSTFYGHEGFTSAPWTFGCTEIAPIVGADVPARWGEGAVSGALACTPGVEMDVHRADTWSFEALAGDEVVVNIDVPDGEAGFWPWIWVNGPEGCAAVTASYLTASTPVCTGLDAACPSFSFTADRAGTWEVVVVNYPYCVGGTAAYSLRVSRG